MPPYKMQRISATELRKKFNDLDYAGRSDRGELRCVVEKQRHPSPPRAREPTCTRSQMLAYFDRQGKRLALAHRYIRPDGKLGGSGKPDPKSLLIDNTLYVPE
ncbi:MAG: hypothetical protein AAB403_02135 [Planctomycetota bacterium]